MKKISYKTYLNFIWALLIIVAILITIFSSSKVISKTYDLKLEASDLSKTCLEEISKYNKDRGVELNDSDIYESYLIGTNLKNLITTTSGSPESKRTTLNPNFAALFVEMYSEAGLKEGDEVAFCFSSSFPGLNISAICAAETMNLKTVIMSSVGSSQLGANDPDFVFPEWVDYLNELNIIKTKIDYVSYGGEFDTIEGFNDLSIRFKDKTKSDKDRLIDIKNRLIEKGHKFIEIEDFKENINARISLIDELLPNLKLFVNIGGSIIGLGRGESSKYLYRGLIEPNYLTNSKTYNKDDSGLLESYLVRGITCISMLNIKGICTDYHIEYDPLTIPSVTGTEDIYYDLEYNKVIPIITLLISVIILIYMIVVNYKKKKEDKEIYE